MAKAVAAIISANPASSAAVGRRGPTRPPPYAPAIPARPKTSPVRHRMRPARAWPTALTTLVTPTTNRDMAIADLAGTPAT